MKTFTINSSLNQVRSTLGAMAKMRDSFKADPDWVELSRSIVRRAGVQRPEDETEAIRRWVKSFIEFRLDPDGVEYLQDPWVLTETQCGDCDDMAMLAAVLLGAIGHDCRPCGVIWQGERTATHAVCWDSSTGLICDPVSDVPCEMWPGPGIYVHEYVMGP